MKRSTDIFLVVWLIVFWMVAYHGGIIHIEDKSVIVNFIQLICLAVVSFNAFPFVRAFINIFRGHQPDILWRAAVYRLLFIFLGVMFFLIASKLHHIIGNR